MRPACEWRQALRQMFQEHGDVLSVRSIVERFQAARPLGPSEIRRLQYTVKNMCRAGELAPQSTEFVPGSKRPVALYRYKKKEMPSTHSNLDASRQIDIACRGWVRSGI